MSRFDNMQDNRLDGRPVESKWAGMTRTPMLIMLAAAAALAGCNKEDHTIVAGGPDAETNDTNAAAPKTPVALPPSIAASKSYRCDNNSLVYVDWLSDGSARVKNSAEDAGTHLAAGAPELKGDAKAASITYKGESCKA
jgi:hypothetical protein